MTPHERRLLLTVGRILRARLSDREKPWLSPANRHDAEDLDDLRHALAPFDPLPGPPASAPYGYCPKCGAPGVSRERLPNGDDRCQNGHVYASRDALPTGSRETVAAKPGKRAVA